VTAVADDQLTIAADAADAGGSRTFTWQGAPLSAAFSVGDAVTMDSQYPWHLVISARSTAAFALIPPTTSFPYTGQIPGGPTYTLEPSCAVPRVVGCGLRVVDSYLQMVVQGPSDGSPAALTLLPGASGEIGGWQITNVFIDDEMNSGPTPCLGVDVLDTFIVSALRTQ